MSSRRPRAGFTIVALLGAVAGAPAPRTAAGAPAGGAPSTASRMQQKSVYGTLAGVHESVRGISMKAASGRRLVWRVHPRVIAEAAKFKTGDPMIVIYRQISATEKRVTAIAFPGSAPLPLYVNTTGSDVLLRSSPMVDGVCGPGGAGRVLESTIPAGGSAEAQEACWCCVERGESCAPGNKTGRGRALLVACFP